ncbi:MAG TPA: FAD-binding oxidoreductase, partial [Burkholderiales bacterium]|nr:FAD-binding oxidoreductase [Burkholderiales bacterium]
MSAITAPAPDRTRQKAVANALRAFLPRDAVLVHAEETKPYECDGLSAYRQSPLVVALPRDESEVRRVLQT